MVGSEFEITGFVNNEDINDLDGELTLTYKNYTPTSDTGSYDIIASGLTSENYNINYVAGILTVNKATVDTSGINNSTIKLTQTELKI